MEIFGSFVELNPDKCFQALIFTSNVEKVNPFRTKYYNIINDVVAKFEVMTASLAKILKEKLEIYNKDQTYGDLANCKNKERVNNLLIN